MSGLSLLIAFRKRYAHLEQLVRVLAAFRPAFDAEFIIIEGDASPTLQDVSWPDERFRYLFVEQPSVFHKTVLLNRGLSVASGDHVIAYDVDLIPAGDTLSLSYELALACPALLVSGYRLMAADTEDWLYTDHMSVAPEDHHTALKKYLIGEGLFGVCPVFSRARLLAIGAWDEEFRGWGAEDQDITDRYCADGIQLARLPKLLYIHLHHEGAEGWTDAGLVHRNRAYYTAKRNAG